MSPQQVVKFYGSQMKAAAALQVTKGAISQWCIAGRVPPLRQLHIEKLSKGRLKADPIERKAA